MRKGRNGFYQSLKKNYKSMTKKKILKTCEVCKKKFYIIFSKISQRFCSRKCNYKWRTKKRKKRQCPICGKFFYQKQLRKFYIQKYCSKKCIPAWNKNLTKETDERVMKYAIKSGKFLRKYVKKYGSWRKGKKFGPSPLRGKKLSVDHRRKLSKAKLGKKTWNFGLRKETNEKISKYFSLNRMGKRNPNWTDGKSKEPYALEFNDELREFIRKRDRFICQNINCGISQKECLRKLTIHHIDYDKKNNDPINLIALCASCNSKVNFNRKYWKNYYEDIQINRRVHTLEKI